MAKKQLFEGHLCPRPQGIIKSSRATICVKWLNGERTIVSRKISVLVLGYPEDEDRDGPRNVPEDEDTDGTQNYIFFTILPFDAAGSPRIFY
jgi:hypothetical protein